MNTLLNFYSFVREINKENGRNYKLQILNKYVDDQDIKYYLDYIYNPYKVTGISDKKLAKQFSDTDIMYARDINTVKELLNYILENNTGSDEVLKIIKKFIKIHMTQYEQEEALENLLANIISKDLNIGVAILSINKVFKNLIPTFNVMLAHKYFDNPDYIIGKEFAITTKIDGGRIIAIKQNGNVKFYTRAGQLYEGLVDLEKEMAEHMPDNICLDGEITLLNPYVTNKIFDEVDLWGDTPTEEFTRKLSSKEQYKETMKITRKDGEKHGVKMLVFDAMPAQDFINSNCNIPYLNRQSMLEVIFNEYNYTYFEKLPILYCGNDHTVIDSMLSKAINDGEEGLMINICDAPYEFGRTKDLLKVKKMQDIDLPIIGYEEGKGLNEGKLGAFLVDYQGNVVKVGGGYTKELREEIWKHPDDYIGLTISVQYFEETSNADGGLSLRFPVFLDFRYDK